MLMNLTENCAYLQSKWHSHKNLWVYCFINWWNMYTFLSHSKSMIIKYLHYYYYDRRWMMKMMDKVNEMCSSFVRLTYTTSTTYHIFLLFVCINIILRCNNNKNGIIFYYRRTHKKRKKERVEWHLMRRQSSQRVLLNFLLCVSKCVCSTHQTMTCY